MSKLRPECSISKNDSFAPTDGTAYLMIYEAVKHKKRLIHGRLHGWGESCAIGSFWDVNPSCALPTSLVDEVAAVNDSVPSATPIQRRQRVLDWLEWKLSGLGMPGFTRQVPMEKSRKKTK